MTTHNAVNEWARTEEKMTRNGIAVGENDIPPHNAFNIDAQKRRFALLLCADLRAL